MEKVESEQEIPKDFIFDRAGPEMIAVEIGEVLQDGDAYKIAPTDKWQKTTLIGQKNNFANYYFRRQKTAKPLEKSVF